MADRIIRASRRLHIRESAPPTVLWVHAFPVDGRMWDGVTARLPGFRHLVPDLPGFGRTPVEDEEPLTMERASDLLFGALEERGIERVVLVGCSMGGYVALSMLRRHPEHVRALVLCDTRAEADDDAARYGREEFAGRIMAAGPEAAEHALLAKLLADHESGAADAVRAMIWDAKPQGMANALLGMGLRPSCTDFVKAINIPTLVLGGEHDAITPPAGLRRLAIDIPDARCEIIPGAGHLPPVEDPTRTAAAIGTFLAKLE